MANTCMLYLRFCVDATARWIWDNKLLTFFILLSFSLFVSTLTLSSQRNEARQALEDLKNSISQTTVLPTEEPSTTEDPEGTTLQAVTDNDQTRSGLADSPLMQLMGYAAS